MATRNDITVIQQLSPRVAEVAQPSTEVAMQDYVDTLRDEEDDFRSMGFTKLIDASGKQNLGGGVLVGITVSELNLQLAFEPNVTPVHIGTVTTPSGPPNAVGRMQFTDTTADWSALNVQPGSFIINFTDNSIVDVVRVVDTDTLETRTLANGTDNQFELGDVIHVFNIRQCTTSGGNLVAVDENDVAISAILPTAFTQVILQTSSSATIQELADIQFSSFNNGVMIDSANITGRATTGTAYPAGTGRAPCLHQSDALAILNELGLDQFYIKGDLTVDIGPDFSSIVWIGSSANKTTITIPAGATVTDCEFEDCTVTGVLDGVSSGRHIHIENVTDLDGDFSDCGLTGTIALAAAGEGEFINCYSEAAGGGVTPIIVIGTASLIGRDYSGGIEFQGKTSTAGMSWDFDSGQAVVNDDNTTGEMTLRGRATWTNKVAYAGTTTVVDQLDNLSNNSAAVWDALIADHSVTGSFGEFIVRRLLTTAKFFALR